MEFNQKIDKDTIDELIEVFHEEITIPTTKMLEKITAIKQNDRNVRIVREIIAARKKAGISGN